jgi:hypothetical protein
MGVTERAACCTRYCAQQAPCQNSPVNFNVLDAAEIIAEERVAERWPMSPNLSQAAPLPHRRRQQLPRAP